MNTLANTTTDFLKGIQNHLYTQTVNGQTSPYNMYSYGYIQQSSGVDEVKGDDYPPVESLSNFPIPEVANLYLNADGAGPYIGTTGDQYFALTDCSGYVIYLIAQASQEALNELIENANSGRSHFQPWPSAAQFANYTGGNYWTQIQKDGSPDFTQIQPGDIISWDESGDTMDTGHVMIAMAQPTLQDDGSFEVKISDSTILMHKDDMRNGVMKGNDPTGAGSGIIGLKIDSGNLQSNFYPGVDSWITHPHINILRLNS